MCVSAGVLGRASRGVVRALLLAMPLVACADSPVQWSTSASTVSAAVAGPVAVTAEGTIIPDPLALLAERVPPPSPSVCPGSLRLARAGAVLHAVWWAPRADSGARLLAAHSGDEGRSWSAPIPVDTLDRGVSGCRRAAPSIAADSASGYVHVAYGMQAPEGPGLFFSHSMDRGGMFHAPVPIFYGERLGRTSVAADGELVAVGFEDPNSRTPRIGLALSRTMGHIFEHRLLPVSSDNGAATRPTTAVRGNRVAIAWEQRAAAISPTAAPVLAVRAGVVH
jgi:hypothetical protein